MGDILPQRYLFVKSELESGTTVMEFDRSVGVVLIWVGLSLNPHPLKPKACGTQLPFNERWFGLPEVPSRAEI
jgi:hypothetical protein